MNDANPSNEAILVRLEMMERRNDERHVELRAALAESRADSKTAHKDHEDRLRDVETWKRRQEGQGKVTWVMFVGFIGLAVQSLWDLFTRP